jgi:hypothetical protein
LGLQPVRMKPGIALWSYKFETPLTRADIHNEYL